MFDRAPFHWTQQQQHTLPVEVSGQLPSWLQGDLVRTAPALFARGSWRAEHWFDGLGLMYGFSIGERVEFRQRLLDSDYLHDVEQPRPALASFATPAQRSLWQRILKPIPKATDNTNVNVIPWQGRWLAMTEGPYQHWVDPQDLSTRGLARYDDALPKDLAMIAHPHMDFQRSALVNVGLRFGLTSEVCVYRQDRRGESRVVEGRLKFKRPPYIHSFGLTPRYALLIDHPYTINPLSLLGSNRPFAEGFRFKPEDGTRIWLLDRETGRFTDYQTEALFCFHTVNAFEDGQDVVFDFVAFDDASIVSAFKAQNLLHGYSTLEPHLVRARLRPGKRHVELERISRQSFELPNIAYRADNGRSYTTAWGLDLSKAQQDEQSTLLRVDLESGSVASYKQPCMIYGEPIFVPRPGASRSDDGVILAVGSHARQETSSLLVLDATRMEPVAQCHVGLNLPLGFHGNFKARA